MGTVYIVQERLRNTDEGMVPVYDFTPAAQYGQLEVVLSHRETALTPGPMIQKLRRQLKDFDDDDYLLLAGDPVAIAAAGMVAGSVNNGKFNALLWDKRARGYIKTQIDMRGGAGYGH